MPAADVVDRLRRLGSVFRSKDAVAAGVAWRDLYRLRDAGEILELSRGVFQLAEAAGSGHLDFVVVCACSARDGLPGFGGVVLGSG